MAYTRSMRPPFDPRHEFVVTPTAGRKTLPVGGAQLPAGSALDKTRVDPRRLRQMYDARLIAIAPGSTLPTTRERRVRVNGPVDYTLTAKEMLAGVTRKSRPRGVPRRRPAAAEASA